MLMHFTSNFAAQLLAPSSSRFELVRMTLMLATALLVWLLIYKNKPAQPKLNAASPLAQ
jgi:hypothetical protein